MHVHVDNSESGMGEELDDVPSWREDDGSKCVIGKLCAGQREQLEGLLQKYQEVFKNKPEKTKTIKHFIHTTDSKPVKQHPYRLPHAYWEEVKQELKDMLAEGVIEPSQSDWVSSIVLVKMKDNSIRLCVDYRELNA